MEILFLRIPSFASLKTYFNSFVARSSGKVCVMMDLLIVNINNSYIDEINYQVSSGFHLQNIENLSRNQSLEFECR